MAFHTIKLKKYADVIEEYKAHAAITPGMLVELNSDNEVEKHNTAGGVALPMFALEDELQGKGIDDAYATGDRVQVWIPGKGDIVNALLLDGENVAIGDFLESGANGYVRKYDGTTPSGVEFPASIVGVAFNAVNMSGSTGADPDGRIQVRIM